MSLPELLLTTFFIPPTTDLYHAYRNLDTNSLHDSNNINQNFSSQPYFDFSVARNVTTRVGQTAFLNCRVEQLGDKLVSFLCFFMLPFSFRYESHYELDDIFQFSRALKIILTHCTKIIFFFFILSLR